MFHVMSWIPRNDYCTGCRHWGLYRGFWGCKRFGVYNYDDRDRLCNGRYKEQRPPKRY